MTCIAAIVQDGKVFMAADRGASDMNMILPLEVPKVWKNDQYLFGYYGTMHGEIVQSNFEPPKVVGSDIDKFMKTKFKKALKDFYTEWGISPAEGEDFGMLIAVGGKIYEHNLFDMSMTCYTNARYLAAGSGAQYAMGSLYSTESHKVPTRRLMIALKCATKFSPTCLEPIDIIS